MTVNDINFVLGLTKDEFDMVVTIMLHDACHDFDNDKSNAAFKEYFFLNKTAPSSAASRLQKISNALGAPPPVSGGGGFMKGGMEGEGESVGPLEMEEGVGTGADMSAFMDSGQNKLHSPHTPANTSLPQQHPPLSMRPMPQLPHSLTVPPQTVAPWAKATADTTSIEENYWQLGEVGKSVLREVLSECGGNHDIIYNGINTIEYVKFLLKIKYSFIFTDNTITDDNDEEHYSSEIVSNIAQWLSERDVIAAYNFKANMEQYFQRIQNPEDHNLNNFRKITSLINDNTNISFIKDYLSDYLSVYYNLLDEVLKEVLLNYIIIGGKSADQPPVMNYVFEKVKIIEEGLDINTAGVIQTFKERLVREIRQMSTDFQITDNSQLLLDAFTIEEQKAQTAHGVAAVAAAAQYSGPVIENFQHIDFILNICDKFNDYAYLWKKDNGLFIDLSTLYLKNRSIIPQYSAVTPSTALSNDDFDFFFEESIRISTNDFTDQAAIPKLETVITQQVTNHTSGIYISEILNKNLLDMNIKTNTGLFDFPIFDPLEFQSAFLAGGYDEWNSVSLQQIQYMEQWNQQTKLNNPTYWFQLRVDTMLQMQEITQEQGALLLQQIQQIPGAEQRELFLQQIQVVLTMLQMSLISSDYAETWLSQMMLMPPENGALLLQQIQDSLRQQGLIGGGNIQTGGDAFAAFSKFQEWYTLVTNPNAIDPLHFERGVAKEQLDASDIEDDDGEHYKQFADDLSASSAAADQTKATQIKSSIQKYLGIPAEQTPTLKMFNSIINQCKNKKKEVTKFINDNLKGAYERGKAAHYMNDLEGFTYLEFNEAIHMSKKGFSFPSDSDVYEHPELGKLLSSFWILVYFVLNIPRVADGTPITSGPSRNQVKKVLLWKELRMRAEELTLGQTSGVIFTYIKDQIKIYENYNKYLSKIIDFLDDQKIYYGSSPKNLTKAEKTERSLVFTEILNYYLPGFDEGIKASGEWGELFQTSSGRPPGGTLDNHLWARLGLTGHGNNFRHHVTADTSQYINNAIPSKCAKILSELGRVAKCFTSVIDPMGTFGECYPVPDPNIEGVIHIDFYTGDDRENSPNRFLIHLYVVKKKKISLTTNPPTETSPPGQILIKMKGQEKVNITNMEIQNFANSKPLSIANTVKLLREHDPEHNAQQIVRKFLGDFLQGVEAIDKGLLYLSGDKPATVMYYFLHSLKGAAQGGFENLGTGGYVDKTGDDCLIYIYNNASLRANLGGGGGLKDKKRVRRSRKRRTNRRKKTNRKKKTQRRKTTKRRSNRRKTNKRRTVRRKNSKRRSTRRKK